MPSGAVHERTVHARPDRPGAPGAGSAAGSRLPAARTRATGGGRLGRVPVIESARGIFDGGYGPLSPRVEDLLDRAFALTEPEVEHLAAASGRTCHGVLYAEALLAASQAAERSGRSVAAGRAAGRAEMLVVQAADARRWLDIDDRARWAIVAQQASWGAADAARALAVCDLLSEAHLRVLTHAWDDLQLAQGS